MVLTGEQFLSAFKASTREDFDETACQVLDGICDDVIRTLKEKGATEDKLAVACFYQGASMGISLISKMFLQAVARNEYSKKTEGYVGTPTREDVQ